MPQKVGQTAESNVQALDAPEGGVGQSPESNVQALVKHDLHVFGTYCDLLTTDATTMRVDWHKL